MMDPKRLTPDELRQIYQGLDAALFGHRNGTERFRALMAHIAALEQGEGAMTHVLLSLRRFPKGTIVPPRPRIRVLSIASEHLPGDVNVPFRMANRGAPLNTARMERVLKKLDIPGKAYNAWSGGQGLKGFVTANPRWSQRAWEVLIVENAEEIRAWTQ